MKMMSVLLIFGVILMIIVIFMILERVYENKIPKTIK